MLALGLSLDGAPDRAGEIPFDADRRRMATIHRQDGRWWVAVKGAPESLARLLGDADRRLLVEVEVEAAVAALARGGYRALALAERWVDALDDDLAEVESDLCLLGLVADDGADSVIVAASPRHAATASDGLT